MTAIIWIGTALTLAGFLGIVWSIVSVVKARRAGLEDAELRLRLNRILPVNLGALFVSVIGLMCVIAGIILA